LTPDRPVLRGTSQNPDVFFQARETVNPFYQACPGIVQKVMERFAAVTGRRYRLFDYHGHPEAERVVILMGSGAEAAHETVDWLIARGEKVGLVRVRLFRPFSLPDFLNALPRSVRRLAVLDRTKEPGAAGEPLYQDVVTALFETQGADGAPFSSPPRVVGGRYGLSSKELTPAMLAGLFAEMDKPRPRNHFTLGIVDDVTHTSLEYDAAFSSESEQVFRALFYGLGSDGTVGANKNSIKIIGEETSFNAQGYFVYDSKKAGSITVSHLRFGEAPIRSTYLIQKAHFVGCHHPSFLDKLDILEKALPNAVFLLNTEAGPNEVWDTLPREAQEHLVQKKLRFYVIDATRVARQVGMGGRINTIMQTCFFAISGVLPREAAMAHVKRSIDRTYGKRGRAVVEMNYAAVDRTLENLQEVTLPKRVTAERRIPDPVRARAPEFVRRVLAPMIAGRGEELPVSLLPCDGTYPTGTAQWEKPNIALEIPIWEQNLCTQCGKCAIVCPHAAIRSKLYAAEALHGAPGSFRSAAARGKEFKELADNALYTIQVAPEHCTGCGICVEVCPAKDKTEIRRRAINMAPHAAHREREAANLEFFLQLPEVDRAAVKADSVRGSQLLQPLFEYSGACAGCGETPYLKLLSQLFGDRLLVANATGCSSIYGGNLPTTPWAQTSDGRGPAWCNSLFEDNAEFGLGFRLTLDKQAEMARELLEKLRPQLGDTIVQALLEADQRDEAGIQKQRDRVGGLLKQLESVCGSEAENLRTLALSLVKKSVWIVGGDGWAYDIGFGGLDHVLASGRNVNILVLDTEVYSNTGGQMSKSTPRSAIAKFAAAGKPLPKKDLAAIAMTYGNVYVAQVAMGANDAHTIRAFLEAESFDGPSLLIAYSHCIAHGIDMKHGMTHQKLAVQCGHWPLFRHDPRRAVGGQNALRLDSKPPSLPFAKYADLETRYTMLEKTYPEEARRLQALAQQDVEARWASYERLAACGSEHRDDRGPATQVAGTVPGGES
jgi:pyruvate-ferredoxin/flavodoxin oxidoreductase